MKIIKTVFNPICAVLSAVALLISAIPGIFAGTGRAVFTVDASVLDDYDFTRLIENCRGILALGAKPHLKLGGVPVKFTSDYEYGGFGMNVYPPDNYNVYYNYIKATASALVDEFGRDEVLSWRFG